MGIAMIVKKSFRPRGSGSAALKPGSPFEASDKAQANLCRVMGWCEDAPARAASAPEPARDTDHSAGTYETRAMQAFPERTAAKKIAAKKTAAKSAYGRRDLRAEE